MNPIKFLAAAFMAALCATAAGAAENVIISEFLTRNQTGLMDENRSREDWIEIYNAGSEPVNLFNWSLSDDAGSPTKWRFPATNIGPGRYMLIWASGNNRRTPGEPLHTSFRLDPSPGEFLGLFRPDGSVASRFSPTYPPQAQDISFGFGLLATTNTLVAAGGPARFLVPSNFSQDLTWMEPTYSDAAWASGTTKLGFGVNAALINTDVTAQMSNISPSVYLRTPFTVADASAVTRLYLKMRFNDGFVAYLNGREVLRRNAPKAAIAAEVANSTNDWTGIQGDNGWYYGYYNRATDANGVYDYATEFTVPDNLADFGLIGRTNWVPTGPNTVGAAWPVRRWVSPVSGVATAQVSVAKIATTGAGVTLRVYLNGSSLFARNIAANDTTGISTNLLLPGIEAGDVLDFALDPTGTDANDVGDLSSFYASIWQAANSDPGFDSAATAASTSVQTSLGETFDLSLNNDFLVTGPNVLAIHGLNVSSTDRDFLIAPELFGVTESVSTNLTVYFQAPTPGAVNGLGRTNLGPLIVDIAHTPRDPSSNQPVVVTARATPTFSQVSGLTLRYRVMYNAETATPMFDDGAHGDGAANDGLFGATIPPNIAKSGEMIRYYIISTDTAGVTNRSPAYLNPAASPQYWGLVIENTNIVTELPVMHWFIQPADITTLNGTENAVRSSFYYKGQFFDNIGNTRHGQSSSGFSTQKKSYNFNLNSGYKMDIAPVGEGVIPPGVESTYPNLSDFALITTWADRSHFRIPLNSEAYRLAGTPAHYAFMLRLQQNGNFFGIMDFTEQGNDDYLERIGFDPEGALYKMYNTFTGANGNEKKTRKYEPSFDLQQLYDALTQPNTAQRTTHIYDNVNLPAMINFLAVKTITSDHDCCHKNYYFYRDSNGSGEWYAFPWDFDLSWGHIWTSAANYFDDTMRTNMAANAGNNNTLFAIMWNDAVMKQMWTRRTRTLINEMLQPPGTLPEEDFFRSRIDFYAGLVRPDVPADKIKWGGNAWAAPTEGPANPNTSNPTNNFEIELNRLKNYHLPGRRTYLALSSTTNSFSIPGPEPATFFINIGAIDYNPASSNQAQEYIEIINTNRFAVDLSGWKLAGGVDFTFAPGTIITATNQLYVSPDVKSFRSRSYGPRANQRNFVVGPYKGQLSARGETLVLITDAGQTNASLVYPGAPSLPQQFLRISEIMYHPPSSSGPFGREDYEYIELRNISPNTTISLVGVKLDDGVEFDFATGSITSLAPGQRCLVVRSNTAFAFRYGAGLPVAGAYSGALENNGERVRLLDASNEEILDFSYNNSWYPVTDGLGFSLVVVDEQMDPDLWDRKAGWRPSGVVRGSPGAADSLPPVVAPIFVNEVLSATATPEVDAVELFNPNAQDVNIGGWFLSDDFDVPTKYRIPTGTVIPAGGYAVFNETHFNASGAGFAFSSDGEEAYVFSGNATTNLTGYYHGISFGPGIVGVSFGAYVNSQTNLAIVSQQTNTLGASNSGPRVGPIVISEIMYAPVDSPDLEFVELRNISSNAVALYDTAFPTNRWRLRDGIAFSFSATTAIPAGSYLIAVPFDPQTNAAALAAFEARYNPPAGTQIVGPYSGRLDNAGENIELASPQAPDTNGVSYPLQDRVDYRPLPPWDISASGIGASLQRIVPDGFGNDPTNWAAAVPSPGRPRAAGAVPTITRQPVGGLYVENSTIEISVEVSGASPLAYQWLFNGTPLAGAIASTLVINNAPLSASGSYSVAIYNGGGAVLSESALVTIRSLPRIVTQPVNRTNAPGSSITFTVAVAGTDPINYQWRMNGQDIPGATDSSLTVENLDLHTHAGFYDVVVNDAIGTVTSTNAALNVSVRPLITIPPVSTSVVRGGTAIFRVVAEPLHPFQPLSYRWFTTNGTPPHNSNSVLYITNVQTTTSVRLNVSNPAGQTNITSGIILTMLADHDGDGIADIWEAARGFNTNDISDGILDTDGDGMINRDEFNAGTDPRDGASVLKLVFAPVDGTLLEFTAQSNISYAIQFSTNILATPWQTLSNIPATDSPRAIPFRTKTNGFYRIVTPRTD